MNPTAARLRPARPHEATKPAWAVCIVVAIALAVWLFAGGCAKQSAHPESCDVHIALSRDGITWLPLQLAESLGYAREEGLKLQFTEVIGLSKGVEAMLAGGIDVAAGSTLQVIQIRTEGPDVRCFLSLYRHPTMALAVSPARTATIRSVADLRHAVVGVGALGSPTQHTLNFVLATAKIRPDEVHAVSVGTAATSLAALGRGDVDAVVLVAAAIPAAEHQYPGLRLLADTRTPEGTRAVYGSETFPVTTLIARTQWLHENAATAQRLTRAVRKAMRWMGEHSAEEVRAHMGEAQRLPDAAADLAAIRTAQQSLSPDGLISPDAVELARRVVAVSSEKVRATSINPADVYTNEFLTWP